MISLVTIDPFKSGTPHTQDIFGPPREEYKTAGTGYGPGEK
jgi:hypothetical protein